MPVSPQFMRMILLVCLIGMALLAFFYLRGRSVPQRTRLKLWLLIFAVPLLGPFLVILSRPGEAPPVHGTPTAGLARHRRMLRQQRRGLKFWSK